MKNLPKFISILEMTREQVQYGYFLVGVNRHETSTLAEHHYLVTMIGWMLCEYLNEDEGSLVDTSKVMQLCLVHDLGELFGGDMAAPLSRKRPDIKAHAQAFEKGNKEILMSFLNTHVAKAMQALFEEEETKVTDEAVVAKIADLMETHFFLEHRNIQHAQKDLFYRDHIRPLADKLSNPKIKEKLEPFFEGFEQDIQNRGFTPAQWILEA